MDPVQDRPDGQVAALGDYVTSTGLSRAAATLVAPPAQVRLNSAQVVLHWYDFICPFCYVDQQRNTILVRREFKVIQLPFQSHPDIPAQGIAVGSRDGPMYSLLEHEARAAGLPLRWPRRLPNSRLALAAAEWVRRFQPRAFPQLQRALFAAHFAFGENLGDPAVIDYHASESGIELAAMHAALADGSALDAVTEAETMGRQHGIHGTPAWLSGERLILGRQAPTEFERL